MRYFPAFLDIVNKPCLVVGGGEVAGHKVDSLLAAQAEVWVVSPLLDKHLASLVAERRVHWVECEFEPDMLSGKALVIAATNQPEVNASVAHYATLHNLPVNVVDTPELCSFIMPAVVNRDPVQIAIGSSGTAPVLVRQIKGQIETLIPANFGDLARWAGTWRDRVKASLSQVGLRRRFWERVFSGPIADQALAGNIDRADALMNESLKNCDEAELAVGFVSLIGAGPGDPELLTLKALRRLQDADIVLYDALVSEGVMNLVRKEAERVYVGKQCNRHAMVQEDINALLLRLAKEGKRVVRLKGGDPFIFGRGAEELELLVEYGVSFEVVPGITSAQGASCYAGVPLTLRDYAHGVSFITGHGKNSEATQDWQALAQSKNTLVFYMGIGNSALIQASLMAHGRPAATPVAVIEKATTPEQRVICATLENLADAVEAHLVQTPALIVVGEVVSQLGRYPWFAGRRTEQYAPKRRKRAVSA